MCQLKIIYLLICLVNVVHMLKYPPSLYLQPNQMMVINSSLSLKMPCLATGYPKPMYRWKKDGNELNFRNDSRISDSLEKGTFEIANPIAADSGVYQCIAENQFGKAFSHLIFVQEATAIEHFLFQNASDKQAPTWLKTPNNTLDITSRQLVFECEAAGVPTPTVQWLKNGQPVRANSRIKVEATRLTFDPVLGDIDTAVYQCNASNEVGYAFTNFYLNGLKFAPTISDFAHKELLIMSKTDVELNCHADGSPKPNITWEKDGLPITSGPKFFVSEGLLRVANTSEKDAGEYRCTASNALGDDYQATRFIILNATRIDSPPANKSVLVGMDARFACRAIADSNLNLKVQWKFNGRRLDPSGDSQQRRKWQVDADNTLHIRGVVEADLGRYTCVASTERDSAEASATLRLHDVPQTPKISKVTCNGVLASVEWTPPRSADEALPILSYDIQISHSFEPHLWTPVFTHIPIVLDDGGHSQTPVQRTVVPLRPWTRYSFRLVARNAVGVSKPSIPYGFCSTKSFPPFKHPENASAVADAPGTLIVSWNEMNQTEHNGEGFRYKVFWKAADEEVAAAAAAADQQQQQQWQCVKIWDWQQTSVTLQDLGIHKQYRIRVESKNNKGHPNKSAPEILAWSGEGKPLKGPKNLRLVKVVSESSAIFSWDPVPAKFIQGKFKGYKVTVKAGEKFEHTEIVNTGETTLLLNSLNSSLINFVKVTVLNSTYESEASNEVQVNFSQT